MRFALLLASLHDLLLIHELADVLPEGARMFGDKAYVSGIEMKAILENGGVYLIAQARVNMRFLDWAGEFDLGLYPHTI